MNTITRIKIGLAIVGLILFGVGVARDIPEARIAGVIVVGIGVILRFFGHGDPSPPNDTPRE